MSTLRTRLADLVDTLRIEAHQLNEDAHLMSESKRIDRVIASTINDHANQIEAELNFEEPPYVEKTVMTQVRDYNPHYGDQRVCICGHPYERHFDSHDNMDACGCKYCGCFDFVEAVDPECQQLTLTQKMM